MAPKVANGLIRILTVHAVAIGLLLRILLAWLLPWLLDHERFIPGVAYTDIDLYVPCTATRARERRITAVFLTFYFFRWPVQLCGSHPLTL